MHVHCSLFTVQSFAEVAKIAQAAHNIMKLWWKDYNTASKDTEEYFFTSYILVAFPWGVSSAVVLFGLCSELVDSGASAPWDIAPVFSI